MSKFIYLIMACILCIGCSIPHTIVPQNYIKSDAVYITVYRKAVFISGGVKMYLEINNEVVCGLWEKDSIKFTIAPGKHRLMVMDAHGQIGQKTTVIFESGKNYYITIRASFGHGGTFIVIEKKGGDNE